MTDRKDLVRITQAFVVPKDWRPVPTSAYDVKIEGRWLWLKRWLWVSLTKLGCVKQHWDREMMMTQMLLDPEKVTVGILAEAQTQFARMYPGKQAVTCYIGMEDMADLMGDPYIMTMARFGFDSKYAMRDRELLGMRIEAVPHMRGILVV